MAEFEIECKDATYGVCADCGVIHSLGVGNAQNYCRELMRELEEKQRIDFLAADDEADPHYSTDYLFGEARGQMFGVLECENAKGETVILRAFSCQYNGVWEVDGWVPPLFDVQEYDRIVVPGDQKIKALGRRIHELEKGAAEQLRLIRERKEVSRRLMKEIHDLYEFHNFTGEKRSIYEAFYGDRGIPTGCGDCCAPKLLNFAAKNGLKPLGLAEFYWGKENRSQTRYHGEFYSCCEGKCQPILGFMLCGL